MPEEGVMIRVGEVYVIRHKVMVEGKSCVSRSKMAGVSEEIGHPVGGKWPPSRRKLAGP